MISSVNLGTGEEVTDVGFFNSGTEEIFEGTTLEELVDEMYLQMLINMKNLKKKKENGDFKKG